MQPSPQPAHSDVTVPSVVIDGVRHISVVCRTLHEWFHRHMPPDKCIPAGCAEMNFTKFGPGVRADIWPAIARQVGIELDPIAVRHVFSGPIDPGQHPSRCPQCAVTAVPALVDGQGEPVEFDDIGRHVFLRPRPYRLHVAVSSDVLGDMLAPFGPSFPIVYPRRHPAPPGSAAFPADLSVHEVPGPYAAWLTGLVDHARQRGAGSMVPGRFLAPAPNGWVHQRHGATLAAATDLVGVWNPDGREAETLAADLARLAMAVAD